MSSFAVVLDDEAEEQLEKIMIHLSEKNKDKVISQVLNNYLKLQKTSDENFNRLKDIQHKYDSLLRVVHDQENARQRNKNLLS